MNPNLNHLQPYPFQKLHQLFAGITPPADKADTRLSIGEPKHATPELIPEAIRDNLDGLASYPLTKAVPALRQTIAEWLTQRFKLPSDSIDPERHVLPVNGTREALFAFAQAIIDPSSSAAVVMPNPFYQIYEGAALLAGARPVFLDCLEDNGFIPDFEAVSPETWQQCQLLYLCSPGNPTGAVIGLAELQKLIQLAEQYDFIIASDECYSEIYQDEHNPPPGLLQAAAESGNRDYKRCVVFHSLSKRSNAPGLRSGFVAGDAQVLEKFLLYRTYHGCAMSPVFQAASIAAWRDETHVIENRTQYREKFHAVKAILDPVIPVEIPPASFYLWLKTPLDDEALAKLLFQQQHITVLPGSYLSRENAGVNPGHGYIRIALVANLNACLSAAQGIRETLQSPEYRRLTED